MKNRQGSWNFLSENAAAVLRIVSANLMSSLLPGSFGILIYFVVSELTAINPNGAASGTDALKWLCWAYVGLFALYIASSMWSQKVSYMNAFDVSSGLRLKLGEKLRRLPMNYFKSNNPGDITARILGDVQKAENVVAQTLPELTAALVTPVILLGFLLFVNAYLAAVVLVITGAAGLFLFVARRTIKTLGRHHVAAVVGASSRFLEYFRTIKLLKSFNLTGDQFGRMDEAMLALKKSSFRTEVWTALPAQLFLFCLDAGYLLLLLISLDLIAKGTLSWQEMLPFAITGFFFFEAIKSVGLILVELGYISLSIRRIGEVFEAPDMRFDKAANLPSENTLSFRDVSFGYNDRPVLSHVSCEIPERSLTALVGVSGSGKSTMTSLMLRFWDADSGQVLIGGRPLTELDPDALMERFATVFQDVFLFNDTIANNIRVGNMAASMDEVVAAARKARCHEFIAALPDGYDTIVGERGGTLSGGERQRISIARAILKNAPIVILDEATASLDPENEADIQQAFESLIKDRTVIVIAHQFGPIQHADQILVLQDGRISERGRHDELLKMNGLYRSLWEKQHQARSWKMAQKSA